MAYISIAESQGLVKLLPDTFSLGPVQRPETIAVDVRSSPTPRYTTKGAIANVWV